MLLNLIGKMYCIKTFLGFINTDIVARRRVLLIKKSLRLMK